MSNKGRNGVKKKTNSFQTTQHWRFLFLCAFLSDWDKEREVVCDHVALCDDAIPCLTV